jgi:hypothetical protein
MIGTALLIAAGMLLVAFAVALAAGRRRRIDRRESAPDEAIRERAEVLQQLSRDRDRESGARARRDTLDLYYP